MKLTMTMTRRFSVQSYIFFMKLVYGFAHVGENRVKKHLLPVICTSPNIELWIWINCCPVRLKRRSYETKIQTETVEGKIRCQFLFSVSSSID